MGKAKKTKKESFSARLVFCHRGSVPQPFSIELMYDGKEPIHRIDTEFPDSISESELYWRDYDEVGNCAVYQRELNGTYYDGAESKVSTMLGQRLDRIISDKFQETGIETK